MASAFDDAYFSALVATGFVAPGPEIASQRLTRPNGSPPDSSGRGSPAIEDMRSLVRGAGASPFVEYALMVTAPHTHWKPAPILETFDPSSARYWIGPLRPFRTARPISFVFTAEGARPYEWADETALAGGLALTAAYEVIEAVALKIGETTSALPLPVGLAINHRFKDIAGPALFSTMEVPDEQSDLSYVIADSFNSRREADFSGQVGWAIGQMERLSKSDEKAAAWLNDMLASRSIDEAIAIFRSLAQSDPTGPRENQRKSHLRQDQSCITGVMR